MSRRLIRRAVRSDEAAQHHVTAVRAFHTGLIAECYQHLHVLRGLANHIEVLRRPRHSPDEKLTAAHACLREMKKLERLRQSWHETYADLRRSVLKVRAVFRRVVKRDHRDV